MKGSFEIRKKDGSLVFEVSRRKVLHCFSESPFEDGEVCVKWDNNILDKWVEEYLFKRQTIQKLNGYTLNNWIYIYPINEHILNDLMMALDVENYRFCPDTYKYLAKEDDSFVEAAHQLAYDCSKLSRSLLADDEEFVYVSDKNHLEKR